MEANLVRLNEWYRLPYVPELVERKLTGAELERLSGADMSFHEREFERLLGELDDAGRRSHLPDLPSAAGALHELVVRVRMSMVWA